jgi:uncharacterized membrane-anchored protein
VSALATRLRAGSGLSKVPTVTALFWVTKVLTTGMGETTSDYLARALGPIPAVGLAGLALLASLAWQLSLRRYVAGVYWLAIVLVSVFGTMAADVLHVGLHIPYQVSAAFFLVVLVAIFAVWYAAERSLSIHSIRRPRPELFYWATVLTTFALGTAAGDLTATSLHWGYLDSGLLFAAAIAVPALAWRFFGLNPILAFWLAYILTRPLGASFADWAAVPASRHGLDLGYGPVSVVLTGAIVALVWYLGASRRDQPPIVAAPEPVGEYVP